MIGKSVFLALVAAVIMFFAGCTEPEEPVLPDEISPITTVKYSLFQDGGGIPKVFIWRDLDGEGGADPTRQQGQTLDPETNYTAVVDLFNENESPVEDIGRYIRQSGISHQLFFETSLQDVSIRYGDRDDDGNPIGLSCQFKTGGPEFGALKITLRSELDKLNEGVDDGDITNAGGQTDLEITFDVEVK